MKKYRFEDYLMEIHAETYTGLDDDMPSAFDDWISNLDGQELIEYADLFALKLSTMHMDEMRERLIDKLN